MVACSSSGDETASATIPFVPCDKTPALECGTFEVPLIHDSTDERVSNINVARLPGIGNGPHEPLVVVSGGPSSGIEVLRDISTFNVTPTSLRERYDIIAFDQRGVSGSLRVDCDHLGNVNLPPYPRDPSEIQMLVDENTFIAEACYAEHGDKLQHVGSNAVAQDLEIMRTLLNAPKLNIIGSSFGTRVTSLYLERYPNTSGRIILDAPLRPNGEISSLLVDTAVARQQNFEQMLNSCGNTIPDCDRNTINATFVARVNSLLDEQDLDTFDAFYTALVLAVDEPDNGEILGPILIDYALSGDSSEILAVIQELGLDEEEEASDDENASVTLERAVLCADDSARPDTKSLIGTLGLLNESSDLFAEDLLPLATSCGGWPEAINPMNDIQSTDGPQSLVIGGSSDVVTPATWAVETADAIGGVFLSSDHQGHTTVLIRGNECVDSIVIEFLLEGSLPLEGTNCD